MGTDSLGSVLQTAATVAAISISLVGLIRGLPQDILERLRLPPSVSGILNLVTSATLMSCALCLSEFLHQAREERDRPLQKSVAMLYMGIVALAIGFLFFTRPDLSEVIGEAIRRAAERFFLRPP